MKMSSNASAFALVALFLVACGDNTEVPGSDAGADASVDASTDASTDANADAMPDAPVACTDASDCDDGDACTTDTCNAASVCAHAATPSDDGIACTLDACDPSTGEVTHVAVDAMCEQDGKSCTVATCSATTGCSEIPMASLCNDDASCSTDSCSPTGPGPTGCVYELDAAACADTAECSADACSPGATGADPATGCTYTADATACAGEATCSSSFDCTCNLGYVGDGLTCTGVMCDPLAAPTNGTVATTGGGFYPSAATYACSTGFALVGDAARTCAPDGTWSGAAPTCGPVPSFFVVRVGEGTAELAVESTAVFLEERDLEGAVLRTIALPTTTDSTGAAFTLNGTATAEGGLSRSSDGRYVTLAGYAATTEIASIQQTVNRTTDATPTHRVVARVAADGTVDTSTLLLNAFSGASVRAASTADGTGFWVSGTSNGSPATGGVHYAPLGNTSATTRVSGTQNNLRHTHVFGGQLYTSAGAGMLTRGVMAVGAGLPITEGETSAPVVTVAGSLAPNSFAVLDLDLVVAGPDTIYLAYDSGGVAGTANLQKWTYDGTTWTQAAFAPTVTGTEVPLMLGLAAWRAGADVHIIVTTAEATSRILEIVDDGSTLTPAASVLATAATNTAFRGVARSPTP